METDDQAQEWDQPSGDWACLLISGRTQQRRGGGDLEQDQRGGRQRRPTVNGRMPPAARGKATSLCHRAARPTDPFVQLLSLPGAVDAPHFAGLAPSTSLLLEKRLQTVLAKPTPVPLAPGEGTPPTQLDESEASRELSLLKTRGGGLVAFGFLGPVTLGASDGLIGAASDLFSIPGPSDLGFSHLKANASPDVMEVRNRRRQGPSPLYPLSSCRLPRPSTCFCPTVLLARPLLCWSESTRTTLTRRAPSALKQMPCAVGPALR